jgi:hypothetical protein
MPASERARKAAEAVAAYFIGVGEHHIADLVPIIDAAAGLGELEQELKMLEASLALSVKNTKLGAEERESLRQRLDAVIALVETYTKGTWDPLRFENVLRLARGEGGGE